jgi:glutathione S-transferase
MATRLITIPFSHYCEKARWALDRCGAAYEEEGHLPLFHMLPARRAGGGRTVPILVDGKTVVADSTPIIAWADDKRPGALYPGNDADASDALALEEDFDTHLGPATRRWAYAQLLPRKDLDAYVIKNVPRFEQLALRATRRAAMMIIKRQLKIDAEGVERSRVKIEDTFARLAPRSPRRSCCPRGIRCSSRRSPSSPTRRARRSPRGASRPPGSSDCACIAITATSG